MKVRDVMTRDVRGIPIEASAREAARLLRELECGVLPVLRGRGPQYAARVQALEKRLSSAGLERSARHVKEATTLAATQFGDIDFLAY